SSTRATVSTIGERQILPMQTNKMRVFSCSLMRPALQSWVENASKTCVPRLTQSEFRGGWERIRVPPNLDETQALLSLWSVARSTRPMCRRSAWQSGHRLQRVSGGEG